MRMMRPGERATGGEPLGTSEATRGVAVMLAVIATAGLMLGGMELLGFSLMVPAAARELVWLEETVGPLRMALLVCAGVAGALACHGPVARAADRARRAPGRRLGVALGDGADDGRGGSVRLRGHHADVRVAVAVALG
jgi:hypothetical protein